MKTKEQKQLKYIPTQVELRSLSGFPSIITYNKFFGNYYEFALTLGFQSRGFKNVPKDTKITLNNKFNDPFNDYSIF